jgi:hypothetical protein
MLTTARVLAVASCFLLASAGFTQAFDLSGQSRTYLQSRELTNGTRLTPLYEYLDLRASGIGSDSFSFSAGGWYRHDLQGDRPGGKDTGDIQYAYLTLRKKEANAALHLGRVLINEGTASEQIDGAYARADLRGGFGVAAFGGLPVETDGDTRSGDSVYGGRVSHNMPGLYTLGATYLFEKNDGSEFRKEEGLDLWLRLSSFLQVMGTSSYNALSKGWMQHQYYAMITPKGKLRFTAEASKVYYKEYFAAATVSAFTFPNIDPQETVTTLGGSADYDLTPALTAGIEVKQLDYAQANDSAMSFGMRFAYAASGAGAGLSLGRTHGPTDRLQYDQQRGYVTRTFGKGDITLDLLHVGYQQPINGDRDAWSGSAALGYRLTDRARVVADAEYAKNPDYNSDVRAMLTLVYAFEKKFEPAKKAPARPGRSTGR